MNPIDSIRDNRIEARKIADPNADICFLALASPDGKASVRTLVLRDIIGHHFLLFMNQTSPKWHLLEAGADYELLLWYPTQQHQYRIRGTASRTDLEFVGKSWFRRPQGSKYLDYVYEGYFPQSSHLESRQVLVDTIAEIKTTHHADDMTAPDTAAGYELIAEEIEMLDLNREDRIHDRRLFTKTAEGWDTTILVP